MNHINLYLSSFTLDEDIIDWDDKILVSVTTFPDEMRDCILVNANQINEIGYSLPVTIANDTKKVNFVFTKVCPMENNPIIASGNINTDELQKVFKDNQKKDFKTYNIFEQIGNETEEQHVIGRMKIEYIMAKHFVPSQVENLKKNLPISGKENHNNNNPINHGMLVEN